GRIKADASALQPQANLADLFKRNARDEEIHRLTVYMLAELCNPAGASAQHRIGFGRAVAADHLDRLSSAGFAISVPQQIEQMGIHVSLFLAPPVAHEPVELLERTIVIASIALEGDGDVFTGVRVVERKSTRVAFGDGVLQSAVRAEQEQAGHAQASANVRQSHNERVLARRLK